MINKFDYSYIENNFLSILDYDENVKTIKSNIINILYLYERTNNYQDLIKNIEKIEDEIKNNKKTDKIINICVGTLTMLYFLFIYIYYKEYEKYKNLYYKVVMNFLLLIIFLNGIYYLLLKDKKKNDIYLKLINNLNELKEIIINNIENK